MKPAASSGFSADQTIRPSVWIATQTISNDTANRDILGLLHDDNGIISARIIAAVVTAVVMNMMDR